MGSHLQRIYQPEHSNFYEKSVNVVKIWKWYKDDDIRWGKTKIFYEHPNIAKWFYSNNWGYMGTVS
jgi:hypothetical protein